MQRQLDYTRFLRSLNLTMAPKVSIIIANRNDVQMLAVTVRSCIEELQPITSGEIVIVDNSDESVYKALASALPVGYIRDRVMKIYRQDFPCLFTARQMAAEKASGEYIACLDSHMLVGHNTILDLTNFMDRHSKDKTLGFVHAPINWSQQHESHSRHDRDLSINELGDWNRAYDHERTITWKGMPWMCRRDWFLNSINGYGTLAKHKVSWGGGDMYLGTKPWLLGYKNWAVPTRPCIHIGPFPKTNIKDRKVKEVLARDKYRLYGSSGNYPHSFGFLVSCYILGGIPMMERNKDMLIEKFGPALGEQKWWDKAIELGQDEKDWLDANKVMSFEDFLERKPWDV